MPPSCRFGCLLSRAGGAFLPVVSAVGVEQPGGTFVLDIIRDDAAVTFALCLLAAWLAQEKE
jgi:hypothetical protein